MKGCCGEIWFRNVRVGLKGRVCWGKGGVHIIQLWSMSRDGVCGGGGLGGEKEEGVVVKREEEGGAWGNVDVGVERIVDGEDMGKESGRESLPLRACGMRGLKS